MRIVAFDHNGTGADIRRYHEWVRTQPCGLCGNAGASEVSYYQGMSADVLGRGMASKAHHLAVAPHCAKCHDEVEEREVWRLADQSNYVNRLSHSEGMAIQCLQTLIEAHSQD